jgi:hypothetical protein
MRSKPLFYSFERIITVGYKIGIHQKHGKEEKKRNIMQII